MASPDGNILGYSGPRKQTSSWTIFVYRVLEPLVRIYCWLLILWAGACIWLSAVFNPFGVVVVFAPVAIVVLLFFPLTLVIGTSRRRRGLAWRRYWLTPLLSFAVVLSVIISQWPLYLSFAMIRPTLDTEVARRNRQPVLGGVDLGLIQIGAVERHGDATCFWITRDALGGRILVYCPSPQPPPAFSILFERSLGGGWHFIVDD